jgi:hypothetical protein
MGVLLHFQEGSARAINDDFTGVPLIYSMFSREHFNSSIIEFHKKYSNKWEILNQENKFQRVNKILQLYLKMTSTYNELLIDSYIIYSDSYGQPVLYFLPMIQTEDSSRFPSFDELKLFLTGDIGSISMDENPINGLLMYKIHPCLTAQFMKEIFDSIENSNNYKSINNNNNTKSKCSYIESWLSFCPFIPIKKSLIK